VSSLARRDTKAHHELRKTERNLTDDFTDRFDDGVRPAAVMKQRW
jgi:hypothetical protein